MPEEKVQDAQLSKTEHEAATKGQSEVSHLKFPEDQIPHDPDKHAAAFNQYDPATGWFWLGLHLEDFTFRRAWGIILSQYAALDNLYTQLEAKMMERMRMMQHTSKPNGKIAQVLANLRRH